MAPNLRGSENLLLSALCYVPVCMQSKRLISRSFKRTGHRKHQNLHHTQLLSVFHAEQGQIQPVVHRAAKVHKEDIKSEPAAKDLESKSLSTPNDTNIEAVCASPGRRPRTPS